MKTADAERTRSHRVVFIATCIVVAGAAGLTYSGGLTRSLAVATHDEVLIALNAHSLATTLHDRNGRLLPLYLEIPPVSWYQPAAVYAEATALTLAPFHIRHLRLITVAVAMAGGVLAFVVVFRATGQRWAALVAALALLTAPAHFIHARLALDYLYPVPFILGWLASLASYDRSRRPGWLVSAGLALGFGFYTYASAMALMPMLLVVTVIYVLTIAPARQVWRLVAAFAVALVPLVVWLPAHPEMITESLARYSLYGGPATGPGGLDALQQRSIFYLDYLDPRFLFRDAASAPLFSIRGWGMLLPATGWVLAIGVLTPSWPRRWRWLLLAGVLIAAAPAVIVDERYAVQRVLPMLPFLAVAAGIGAAALWTLPSPQWISRLVPLGWAAIAVGSAYLLFVLARESRTSGSAIPLIGGGLLLVLAARIPNVLGVGRVIVIAAALAMAAQFAAFRADYFEDYPRRARGLQDGDLPEALDSVVDLAGTATPAILLDAYINLIDEYWRFTLLTRDRLDLVSMTTNYRPEDLDVGTLPSGALILARRGDDRPRDTAAGIIERVQNAEAAPIAGFIIYRKR